ncbi:NEST protein, partial [Atractosteus spatula]|nr:NEST protein [Atractosteus spatula]
MELLAAGRAARPPPGEEKLQMWDLNKRLESYLSRVKALEEENELLRAQIATLHRSQPEPGAWRAELDRELARAREAVEAAGRSRDRAELERDHLSQELGEAEGRRRQELAAQEEARRRLAEGRRALEEEKRAQIWLRERAAQLEKELQLTAETHQEDVSLLRAALAHARPSPQPAPALQPDPALQLRDLGLDYSQRAAQAWREAAHSYQSQLGRLEDSLAQAQARLTRLSQEKRESCLAAQGLARELEAARARKGELERSAAGQRDRQREELGKLQAHIDSLEQEKESLREQIAALLVDRQNLQQLKMSLGLEVATYRALLDTESLRFKVPSASLQLNFVPRHGESGTEGVRETIQTTLARGRQVSLVSAKLLGSDKTPPPGTTGTRNKLPTTAAPSRTPVGKALKDTPAVAAPRRAEEPIKETKQERGNWDVETSRQVDWPAASSKEGLKGGRGEEVQRAEVSPASLLSTTPPQGSAVPSEVQLQLPAGQSEDNREVVEDKDEQQETVRAADSKEPEDDKPVAELCSQTEAVTHATLTPALLGMAPQALETVDPPQAIAERATSDQPQKAGETEDDAQPDVGEGAPLELTLEMGSLLEPQQASSLPVSHGGLGTQESELERCKEQDGATAELKAGSQEETLEPCIAALQHSSVLLERPPQGALEDPEVSDDDELPTKATEASAGVKDSWAPELMDELTADTRHPESMISSGIEERREESPILPPTPLKEEPLFEEPTAGDAAGPEDPEPQRTLVAEPLGKDSAFEDRLPEDLVTPALQQLFQESHGERVTSECAWEEPLEAAGEPPLKPEEQASPKNGSGNAEGGDEVGQWDNEEADGDDRSAADEGEGESDRLSEHEAGKDHVIWEGKGETKAEDLEETGEKEKAFGDSETAAEYWGEEGSVGRETPEGEPEQMSREEEAILAVEPPSGSDSPAEGKPSDNLNASPEMEPVDSSAEEEESPNASQSWRTDGEELESADGYALENTLADTRSLIQYKSEEAVWDLTTQGSPEEDVESEGPMSDEEGRVGSEFGKEEREEDFQSREADKTENLNIEADEEKSNSKGEEEEGRDDPRGAVQESPLPSEEEEILSEKQTEADNMKGFGEYETLETAGGNISHGEEQDLLRNLEDEAESKEDENGTGQDEGAQITGSGWSEPQEERDREGQEERRTEDPPESVTDSEADKDVQEERPITAEQEAEVQLAEEKEGAKTETAESDPEQEADPQTEMNPQEHAEIHSEEPDVAQTNSDHVHVTEDTEKGMHVEEDSRAKADSDDDNQSDEDSRAKADSDDDNQCDEDSRAKADSDDGNQSDEEAEMKHVHVENVITTQLPSKTEDLTAEEHLDVSSDEENCTEDVKPAPLHQASARSDVDVDVSGALEKTEAAESHPDQSVEEKQEEGQNLSMLTNVDSTEQLSLASELSGTMDTVALARSESEGSCSSDDESPNVSQFSQTFGKGGDALGSFTGGPPDTGATEETEEICAETAPSSALPLYSEGQGGDDFGGKARVESDKPEQEEWEVLENPDPNPWGAVEFHAGSRVAGESIQGFPSLEVAAEDVKSTAQLSGGFPSCPAHEEDLFDVDADEPVTLPTANGDHRGPGDLFRSHVNGNPWSPAEEIEAARGDLLGHDEHRLFQGDLRLDQQPELKSAPPAKKGADERTEADGATEGTQPISAQLGGQPAIKGLLYGSTETEDRRSVDSLEEGDSWSSGEE